MMMLKREGKRLYFDDYNNNNNNANRTIPNNKPDIIIRDNKIGTCMLIDVAIPGDRNMNSRKLRRF